MAAPTIPNWQQAILNRLGAPTTPQNLSFLNAWTRAEGGAATNNPFNTTQPAPGASSYNSVGVRNFVSPQQGVSATVQTLQNGRYGQILDALKAGNDAKAAARALADSPWGTGNLVLKILGADPPPTKIGGAPAPSLLAAPPTIPTRDPNALQLLAAGASLFGFDPSPLAELAAQAPAPAPGKTPQRPAGGPAVAGAKPPKTGRTIRFLQHFAEPFGLTVTSTTGGKHAKGSYHYRGRAVDFGGDPHRMAALATAALEHPQDFREMFYTGPGSPGFYIKDGKVHPNSQLDPALAADHVDHTHLAA
jgi:hypothetical protein